MDRAFAAQQRCLSSDNSGMESENEEKSDLLFPPSSFSFNPFPSLIASFPRVRIPGSIYFAISAYGHMSNMATPSAVVMKNK